MRIYTSYCTCKSNIRPIMSLIHLQKHQ